MFQMYRIEKHRKLEMETLGLFDCKWTLSGNFMNEQITTFMNQETTLFSQKIVEN